MLSEQQIAKIRANGAANNATEQQIQRAISLGNARLATRRQRAVDQRIAAAPTRVAEAKAEIERLNNNPDQGLVGRLGTLGATALDSLTFGNAGEIAAGLGEVGEAIGLSVPRTFRERVQGAEDRIDQLNVANPTTGFIGDVAGAVVPALATGVAGLGAAAARKLGVKGAATAGARAAAPTGLANVTARSGAIGAGGGFVADDETIGAESGDFLSLPQRGSNALTGGLIGLGLPLGLSAANRVGRGTLKQFGRAARFGTDDTIDNFISKPNEIVRRSKNPEIEVERREEIAERLITNHRQAEKQVSDQFSEVLKSKPEVSIKSFKDDVKKLKSKFDPKTATDDDTRLEFKAINDKLDSFINLTSDEVVTEVVQKARPSVGLQAVTRDVVKTRTREVPDIVSGNVADSLTKKLEAFRVNSQSIRTSNIEKQLAGKAEKIASKFRNKLVGSDLRSAFKEVKDNGSRLGDFVGNLNKNLTREKRGAKLEKQFKKALTSSDDDAGVSLKRLNRNAKRTGINLEQEALDQQTIRNARPGLSRGAETLRGTNQTRNIFEAFGDSAFRNTARAADKFGPRVGTGNNLNRLLNNFLIQERIRDQKVDNNKVPR